MSIYFVLALASFNLFGARGANVLLPLYALDLGAHALIVGLLAATFSVLPMLLAVPAGRLADRYGARWPLVGAGALGALGMLVPYFWATLPAIFIAAALIGLAEGIYSVLVQNLVGLLSKPQDRARNFSNYALIRSVGNFAGPLIAGFSIDGVGHGTACTYLALIVLVPSAIALIWRATLRVGVAAPAPSERGIRTMLAKPEVRKMLATSSLLNAGRDMFNFYLPVYAHAIGLSASAIGIVLAINAAAAFFVRIILPWLTARFSEEKVLAYAFLAGAGSLILVPFLESPATLGVISFLFGLGMGCGQPIVTTLMFTSSPKGRSGEGMGLRMTVNHLTRLVAPVAFGSIGSALGLLYMFWINALLLGIGANLSRVKKKS